MFNIGYRCVYLYIYIIIYICIAVTVSIQSYIYIYIQLYTSHTYLKNPLELHLTSLNYIHFSASSLSDCPCPKNRSFPVLRSIGCLRDRIAILSQRQVIAELPGARSVASTKETDEKNGDLSIKNGQFFRIYDS